MSQINNSSEVLGCENISSLYLYFSASDVICDIAMIVMRYNCFTSFQQVSHVTFFYSIINCQLKSNGKLEKCKTVVLDLTKDQMYKLQTFPARKFTRQLQGTYIVDTDNCNRSGKLVLEYSFAPTSYLVSMANTFRISSNNKIIYSSFKNGGLCFNDMNTPTFKLTYEELYIKFTSILTRPKIFYRYLKKKSGQVGTVLLYIRGWGGPRTKGTTLMKHPVLNFKLLATYTNIFMNYAYKIIYKHS
ncbi:hypothetical protein AGLY_017783 [Aphis glycines]|uniref:Uncharacterized protein n=1 Tax=Aphis glycines TaxID=307491 RepID=A0A6G0SU67_APHGL|nr:hypothetical protein AGLY_017783 [Aphis glycines]